MPKTSEIKFKVKIDDSNLPEKIEWMADDAETPDYKESKTLFLSLWDKKDNVTMSFDIWTKDMLVDDMNVHFHQTLVRMADTYKRSTNNAEVSEMIKKFAADFAEKLNLFNKNS